jgi:hypothetical protein
LGKVELFFLAQEKNFGVEVIQPTLIIPRNPTLYLKLEIPRAAESPPDQAARFFYFACASAPGPSDALRHTWHNKGREPDGRFSEFAQLEAGGSGFWGFLRIDQILVKLPSVNPQARLSW